MLCVGVFVFLIPQCILGSYAWNHKFHFECPLRCTKLEQPTKEQDGNTQPPCTNLWPQTQIKQINKQLAGNPQPCVLSQNSEAARFFKRMLIVMQLNEPSEGESLQQNKHVGCCASEMEKALFRVYLIYLTLYLWLMAVTMACTLLLFLTPALAYKLCWPVCFFCFSWPSCKQC